MTVIGNEQRVYGVLVGDCYFDLRRIALVINSETDNPTIAATVYYGNDEIYARIKNCGNLYKGYLSILFSLNNNFDNPIAVAEIRKCATGKSYIFIESYGIDTTTIPISLWFNQGTISIPDWIKLNSISSGIMLYNESSFKFSEKKIGEVIEITGCRKCDGGACLVCNIGSRFKVDTGTFGFTGCKSITVNYPLPNSIENWSFEAPDTNITFTVVISSPTTVYGNTLPLSNYGVKNYGAYTYKFQVINVEYKLHCETIDIFVYETSNTGVCIVYYKDDLLIWNNIYDTLSLPTNYTWNLNNDGDPTHAIVKNGSTITYEYPFSGLKSVNYTDSYNVYVKSNDIYEDFTPKYLEKSTNNCVTITQNCLSPRWNSYLGEKGVYTNGTVYISLASGYGGLGEGTYGLFSFNISTDPSLNKLKITSNGNDYYLEVGWYPIGTGTGNGIEYIDGKFYVMYGHSNFTYITVMNNPTSIISSGGFPMYWWENTSFWFDNRFMNSYASIRAVIGLPIIYRFQFIYKLDGTLDPDLTVVNHNPNLVVTSLGRHLQGVVFNNILYMIPDFDGYGVFTLTSLTDYGTQIGTMNFNGCWSSMKSLCVHNGRIYVYGTSPSSTTGYAILEVDIDECKLQYIAPATQGADYDAHLISCGNYLVCVVGATGFVPIVDIYINSDLGI